MSEVSAMMMDKMLSKLWDMGNSMKDVVSSKALLRNPEKTGWIIPQGGDINVLTALVPLQRARYLVLLLINYLIIIFVVRFAVENLGLTAYHGVLASVTLIMVVGYLTFKALYF